MSDLGNGVDLKEIKIHVNIFIDLHVKLVHEYNLLAYGCLLESHYICIVGFGLV